MLHTRLSAAIACALISPSLFASDCTRTSIGHHSLDDLGAGLYLGQFQGGLYPGGENTMPQGHSLLGMQRANNIRPLNVLGQPAAQGRYVLLSIGMSNTTQEFCGGATCTPFSFSGQAAASPDVNHTSLAIIDGAAGGQTAGTWDSPTDANYTRVRDTVLAPRGLSEQQVQAAWIKVANSNPTVPLPAANADAFTLVEQMGNICRALKTRYPNMQQAFLSSRIYAGYATTTLNPEPYAFESGFAVKWLIEAQLRQLAGGGIDPRAGDLSLNVAPWLAWGPYLWADGLDARSDGLIWRCQDLEADGTHPSSLGEQKVGAMLLDFFLTSPATRLWFRADAGAECSGDFNGDGGIDGADLEAFFFVWERGGPRADVNRDGGVDGADVDTFFASWESGGCV
ncbi:MAG: hypothetical protein JSR77_14180 [Planctomycetes bacterium]|nr:hypothetical protein [Planctomycetota bacterium]